MHILKTQPKLCGFWSGLVVALLLAACGEDAKISPTPAASSPQPEIKPTNPTSTPGVITMSATPTSALTKPLVAPQIKRAQPVAGAEPAALYKKFELAVDLEASFTNPFDPAQVDLQGIFTAPDSTVFAVPGFYFQDFSSQLEAGNEVLVEKNPTAWRIRFTPTQVGHWKYHLKVSTPSGIAETPATNFEVTSSASPGFIKASPRDPAYLEFSNGSGYFAVGQNTGWAGKGGTYEFASWFKKMAQTGANFGRVWMASWSFGLEWNDTSLGDYTKRLNRAWQLDRVFDLAAENNIYLMLTLINHGAFSKTTNPEWDKNPYNAALGGPCKEPQDFATDATARDLFKRRLRYSAARWGYSPNLLAWEWWNEVDFTPISNRTLLTNWVKEMTAHLQTFDPYNHLHTLSYSKGWDETVFRLPEINLLQRHEYTTQDLILGMPRILADGRALGKPVFYGELGGSGEGADTLDKDMVHLRNGQWINIMSKGAGTSMNWWWDNYIDPHNLYELFKGPAAFMQNEDPAAQHYTSQQPKVAGPFTALVLKSDTKWLGWVRSDKYSFREIRSQYEVALSQKKTEADFKAEYPTLSGQKLNLPELAPGVYTLEWWDTRAGTVLNTQTVQVKEPGLSLDLPDFSRDLAFKLSRK